MSEHDTYKSLQTFDATLAKWSSFQLKFRLMLDSRDLLHIIDRENDVVDPGDSPEQIKLKQEQAKTRAKDDRKVKSLFANKLNDDALQLVEDLPTAYEMFRRLKSQYQSDSAASLLGRLDRLLDIEYKPGTEISSHIGAINTAINQLRKSGSLDWDKLHVIVLLRSLPKTGEWNTIAATLKAQNESDLTKEKVIRTISEASDEIARGKLISGSKGKEPAAKPAAFTADGNAGDRSRVKCYGCGKLGHFKRDCKAKSKEKKSNSENVAKSSETKAGHYAFVASDGGKSQDTWFKDSGASKHYTGDRSSFSELEPSDGEVEIANGVMIPIVGVGKIQMVAKLSDGRFRPITLEQVYYAPGLTVNLMSTAILDKHGFKEVAENGVTTFYKDGEEIMNANLVANRWVMDWSVDRNVANFVAANDPVLWHRRLCHLSESGLRKLEGMVDGLSLGKRDVGECDDCNKGKMTRRSFKPSKSPVAKYPLDLLHLDVVIVNITGVDDEEVVLIGTDDHSGCRFAFPMVSKAGAEILQAILDWMPWAERMSNRKLKCIRHDNAKEFTMGVFAKHMKELGVESQRSVEYEHEQNGLAERSNRVIMDKARCILIESGLGKEFWPYAVRTAVFGANRSPYADREVVPIEGFTGIKPNLKNMRVFGSKCWARRPSEKLTGKNKLDERAIECRMLGYDKGGHAYQVLNWETKEIFVSTNVRFQETLDASKAGQSRIAPEKNEEIVDFESGNESGSDPDSDLPDTVGNGGASENEDDIVDDQNVAEVRLGTPPRLGPPLRVRVPAAPAKARKPPAEATRKSTRQRAPVRDYWKLPDKGPVHYAYLTFSDLERSGEVDEWKPSMDAQMAVLQKYGTWELRTLPPGERAIGSKWVFQLKSSGKRKSRLVARGDRQQVDEDELMYAPIVKPSVVRVVLVVANSREMKVHQSDVEAAYLNGEMEDDVYMEQPKGYEVGPKSGPGKLYCFLRKSLYGTRQAGRQWRKRLQKFLESLGFTAYIYDRCVFVKGTFANGDIIIIVVWVDDLLTVYDRDEDFAAFWKALNAEFKVQDLGPISKYVGMDVTRDISSRKLEMRQQTAIESIVETFGMSESKIRATPMEESLRMVQAAEGDERCELSYRGLVGSLMHPMLWTRPDLGFVVGALGQFSSDPTMEHWKRGMDVMRYLKGTSDLGLVFHGSDNFELVGYADSDWANDLSTGKSVYGYSFFCGGNLVSWKSKKSQSSTATSTTNAEIVALYHATMEGVWLAGFLHGLGLMEKETFKVYQDNQAAIAIVNGEKYLERTKHEIVKIESIRDYIRKGIVTVEYVKSEDMVADVFTKSLGRNKFWKHVGSLGLERSKENSE